MNSANPSTSSSLRSWCSAAAYRRNLYLQARLVQDVAYQSLLKSTRQRIHQRIARTLEEQFPATAETQPELLAYHYTEAQLTDQAIDYWQRAGQRASKRSATVEAIAQLSKALELLESLPPSVGRDRKELGLRIDLTTPLIASKGMAAPEMGQTITRARSLCERTRRDDANSSLSFVDSGCSIMSAGRSPRAWSTLRRPPGSLKVRAARSRGWLPTEPSALPS